MREERKWLIVVIIELLVVFLKIRTRGGMLIEGLKHLAGTGRKLVDRSERNERLRVSRLLIH